MRITVFAFATFLLAWISRRSLVAPKSHGFWRFFAWECIVALACVNFVSVTDWFRDPVSPRQLVSWILLCASIIPLLAGTHQLRHAGKPDAKRRGHEPLLAFEGTTRLVTTGVFRWIRHPMYCSLLLVTWGVYFKRPSAPAIILATCATAFLHVTARREEVEDITYFGEPYRAYMRSTKRFIPMIW